MEAFLEHRHHLMVLSDDGTTRTGAEYARQIFILPVDRQTSEGGPYAAMNAGLEQARGHYTTCLIRRSAAGFQLATCRAYGGAQEGGQVA